MEKYEELLKRIEELEDVCAELEGRIRDVEGQVCSEPNELEEALLYSDLDAELKGIPTGESEYENLIVLHRDCFRTFSIANAIHSSGQVWCELQHRMITPAYLSKIIKESEESLYIYLKSNIFSQSDEFEKIISDAIKEKKVYFVIFTGDLNKIPQSIRNLIRVIE